MKAVYSYILAGGGAGSARGECWGRVLYARRVRRDFRKRIMQVVNNGALTSAQRSALRCACENYRAPVLLGSAGSWTRAGLRACERRGCVL